MVTIDTYIVADLAVSIITITNPSYSPQRWHKTIFMIATILFVSAWNILLARHLSICEGVFATCHFFAFVPVALGLLLLAPGRDAREVFLEFTDNGGHWPNLAMSVLVGQMSSMFVMLGGDGVAHLAEEIEDAGIILPRAMVWTYLANAPLAILMAVVYCFSIQSVDGAVNSTAAPVVHVFEASFRNQRVTIAFSAVLLCLIVMVAIAALASTSRQIFAFARDRALPLSPTLSTIHPTFDCPVFAIIATALFTIATSLINIASAVAFEAMMSLAIVALMATYLISIGCVALRRMRGQELPLARWSLGRHGLWINVVAMVYSGWSFFWCFFPRQHDPTPATFNWACVMFGVFCGFAGLMYRFHARDVYEGPVAHLREEGGR